MSGKKRVKKSAKKQPEKVDGWSPKDVTRLRAAIRSCWRYSRPHKLVNDRCLIAGGFSKCEKCKKKCPKVFVDHIEVMGSVFGERYLERMGCPSSKLQGLCKKCHDAKTKIERREQAIADADF